MLWTRGNGDSAARAVGVGVGGGGAGMAGRGGGYRERFSFALGRRENQGSLFRSGASLPTARGHESSEGRLQRAIFEK